MTGHSPSVGTLERKRYPRPDVGPLIHLLNHLIPVAANHSTVSTQLLSCMDSGFTMGSKGSLQWREMV